MRTASHIKKRSAFGVQRLECSLLYANHYTLIAIFAGGRS